MYDPGTECFSSDYAALIGLSIVFCCLLLALSVWIMGYNLWHYRHVILESKGLYSQDNHVVDARTIVGFLYLDYEPKFWFWESIVFSRKIALMTVALMFPITIALNVRMLVSRPQHFWG